MSPQRRSLLLAVAVLVVVALAAAGYFAYTNHQQSALKSSLASGYATQPLTAPFTPRNQTWSASSQTWQYSYTANLTGPDAVAAAKSQLAKGAYQVDARHPDTSSADSTTLYRDLITEDVALTVQISPDPPAEGQAATSTVTVTLSPMHN